MTDTTPTPETFTFSREEALELRALMAEAAQAKAEVELAQGKLQAARETHARAAQALRKFRDAFEEKYTEGGSCQLERLDLDKATGTRVPKEPGGGDG